MIAQASVDLGAEMVIAASGENGEMVVAMIGTIKMVRVLLVTKGLNGKPFALVLWDVSYTIKKRCAGHAYALKKCEY